MSYQIGFLALTDTDLWVIAYSFSLLVVVIIFIAQIIGILYNNTRKSAVNSKHFYTEINTRVFLYCLFGVYIISFIGIITVIRRLYDATDLACKYSYQLSVASYATLKLFNYIFFLQRAKCTQGISPILKYKYFNCIFPCVLIIFWTLEIFMLVLLTPTSHKVTSESGSGRVLCVIDELQDKQWFPIIIQMIIDIGLTALFLFLFYVPWKNIHEKRSSFEQQQFSTNIQSTLRKHCCSSFLKIVNHMINEPEKSIMLF